MKTILLTAGLALTFNAFALTQFEKNVSTNAAAFNGSKNYDAKHVNDDGTISLVNPKFSSPDGTGNLNLSISSDLDGVCRLYGLKSKVENGAVQSYTGERVNTVIINQNGRFGGFDNAHKNYIIKSIICRPASVNSLVSDNAQLLTNDDGSVTLVAPRFMVNGENTRIAANSDLHGICHRFGMGAAVPNGMLTEYLGYTENTTVVDSSGNFTNYNNAKKDYVIKSLLCEPGNGYPANTISNNKCD